MPTAKELREKRAPIRKELNDLGEKIKGEGRAMTPEERTHFDKLEKDFNDLTAAITDVEKLDTFARDDSRSDPKAGRGDADPREERRQKREDLKKRQSEVTDEHRTIALQAWMRKANGLSLRKHHIDACQRTGLNPNAKRIDIRLPSYRNGKPDLEGYAREARDMGVASPTAGGYTVAPEFMANLETAMLAFNGVRQVADVMRTATGAPMPWPTLNDTSNSGERIDENTAVAAQEAAVATVTFAAYKYSSKLIPLSFELLNDSAFNMAAVVAPMLGERIGRIQAVDFATGTGTNQPYGAVTGSSLGADAAATSFTVDDIINLVHSVDPAYRQDPSCAFMMHDLILAAIRKLRNGTTGEPIFTESYRAGEPSRILGYPVFINQSMDSTIADTKKTMLFGTWSKYKIRDVGTIRLRRLDERYAEKDQVGFIAFMRSDGRLLNAGTNPLRHLLQST